MKNNVLFEIPNPEERKNVILQIIRIVFHLKFESQKMPNERKWSIIFNGEKMFSKTDRTGCAKQKENPEVTILVSSCAFHFVPVTKRGLCQWTSKSYW